MKTQSQYATNGTKSNFRDPKFDQNNKLKIWEAIQMIRPQKVKIHKKKNHKINFEFHIIEFEFLLAY